MSFFAPHRRNNNNILTCVFSVSERDFTACSKICVTTPTNGSVCSSETAVAGPDTSGDTS